jgi:hypothetical protein
MPTKRQPSLKSMLKENIEAARADQTWLQRFTTSRGYEISSGLLIVFNTIFIAWQIQAEADEARDLAARGESLQNVGISFTIDFLEMTFLIAFSLELGIRWAADGFLDFFRKEDLNWKVFDACIVFYGVFDKIIELLIREGLFGNLSFLRVFRIFRIVRVARVIRVMRFFRELRVMVFSLLRSGKSLLWCFAVLAIVFLVSGVILTRATLNYLTEECALVSPGPAGVEGSCGAVWADEKHLELQLYFGTLTRSMLSLFMSMSGGNDWAQYYDALDATVGTQYTTFYIIFITFSVCAVMNIITAVFIESAIVLGSHDRDLLIHQEFDRRRDYYKEIRDLFNELHVGDRITADEFEHFLQDDNVNAFLAALHLEVHEPRKLFALLDYDGSGSLDIEEFVDGCFRLHGGSRELNLAMAQADIRWVKWAGEMMMKNMGTMPAANSKFAAGVTTT